MSLFQRIRGVVTGVLLFLLALIMVLAPNESYYIVTAVLFLSLLLYGLRMMWFYFTMARHMVGGRTSLYQAIIILDLAVFTGSVTTMGSYIIMAYLLGAYAFSGFVDILRAMEAKKIGASRWKIKLLNGVIMVTAAIAMTVFGLFVGRIDLLVIGYALSLAYSAVMRIVISLRKTAIVYIQ